VANALEGKEDSEIITSTAKALNVQKFDISMPLRLMPLKPIVAQAKRGGLMIDPGVLPAQTDNHSSVTDPLIQTTVGVLSIPAPTVSFNALANIAGVSPPDPNADVGPNHVFVMSNLSFHILDKSGVSVFGPAANNTIWTGFGGDCETDNAGDPVVLYDQLADRWLVSQFTSSGPEFFNCVAISTSSDPTGSYFRWAVSNGTKFPDYPKYGIWQDGYYISTRDFENGSYVSVGVYALKRDDILTGNPNPTIVYLFVDRTTNPWRVGDGLLPADIDGFDLPPLGAPEYFVGTMDDGANYGAAEDALLLWKYAVDFDTPANSTFTLTDTLPIAAMDTIFPCNGGRSCIPQKDTTNRIDIQSYRQRPLHRLAYRNFGTHESLVTNQSVEAAAGLGGIRWWEVRSPDSNPVVFQEGTYAPGVTDGIHRWMGSVAMDSSGNIGLAYSASSTDIFPAIRYSGRLNGDPLGTLPQGEGSIVEGLGSQTGSQRWGDYTSLTVDPVDDCTFWHVNEYFESSSNNGWQLRVGAFRFDECGDPSFFLRPTSPALSICAGVDANYDLFVGVINGFNAPVTLSTTGIPATASAGFSTNPVPVLPANTTLNITNTAAVLNGTYNITVTGTAPGTTDKNANLALTVFEDIPMTATLLSPADNAINVDVLPSLNWSGDNTLSYTIELATDVNFNNIIFTGNTTGQTIVPTVTLNTNTDYYWRVRANNSCGDANYSATFTFKTLPAPGDCNDGFRTINNYTYGFESGLNGWVSNANVGANIWTESSVSSHSGIFSMHAVDVSTISDQLLTSPVLNLPLNQNPLTLQFWNKQTMEDRVGGCFDGGLLEISTDNGATFTQISNTKLLTDPYDGATTGDNPLTPAPAWCGDPQDWLNSIVDLNEFAGMSVLFRFRLGTDGSVDREGWFVDDVKVRSCVPFVDLIYANGFE
jgi:hypothetical protein